jgi:hypothetical protein
MKTENPSACATVSCKVYRRVTELQLPVVLNCVKVSVSINPIIQYRTRYYSSRNPGHVIIFKIFSAGKYKLPSPTLLYRIVWYVVTNVIGGSSTSIMHIKYQEGVSFPKFGITSYETFIYIFKIGLIISIKCKRAFLHGNGVSSAFVPWEWRHLTDALVRAAR